MKKFSPPQMKEVSFPTPHTRSDLGVRLRRELSRTLGRTLSSRPKPTPHTLFQVRSRSSGELRMSINQLNALFSDFRQFYAYFSHFCPFKN